MPEAQPTRTFYSRVPNLTVAVNTGPPRHNAAGQLLHEPKFAEFSNAGAHNGKRYGTFYTSDPDLIAYMEKKIAEGHPDYLSEEQFLKESIPAEQRADVAETKLDEALRRIDEQNRLIADLQARGKLPVSK